ncbi:ABC transporter ATP-binding protein [Propioniciclava soli]|uniref:ABC transporter ATP-binding protein n=1 Tax=Propioniciclava soli TaxID=2775081 RepID=UPI0039F6BA13
MAPPPAPTAHPAAPASPRRRDALVASGLVHRFGQVVALGGVSLTIPAGQSVAVMGPSGSGKSTLLHCLSGILTPDAGEVTLGGGRVSTLRDADRSRLRRERFGFVFQDGQLIGELPARENVALPLLLAGMGRAAALAHADSWLERLGVGGDMRLRRPGELSGGQAQRVAIARALVHDPAVIFADEPTGALDQATGHEVMQILTTTASMAGATLVVVTHDPHVARWCSRLVEIRDALVHSDTLATSTPLPTTGTALPRQEDAR